ncbi:MAG: TonB-dependent receptor, partial [Myxococcales bacterium]|nr:TonB-dependent receptor [Myxococcales bacterium]
LNNYDLGVYPSFRFNTTLQWAMKGLGAGINIRYIGSYMDCDSADCSEESNFAARDVDSNTTMDLFASYGFSNPAGYTRIQAGINNLADQTPPVIYNGFLAASDASMYDYLGRYFYVGISHKL